MKYFDELVIRDFAYSI